MSKRFHMTAQEVAEKIGIPLEKWEGNCDWIANELVKQGIVEGRVVRGFWHGVMKGYWEPRGKAAHFTQHSWIELPDVTTVDPTRWSFENTTPYIYVGHFAGADIPCHDFDETEDLFECFCGHVDEEHYNTGGLFRPCMYCTEWPYDEGGNRLREEMMSPPPTQSGPQHDNHPETYDFTGLPEEALRLFDKDTQASGILTWPQAFWLANAPIYYLGDEPKITYDWLSRNGFSAMIPIDNARSAGL